MGDLDLILHRYRSFQECLLRELYLSNFGTELTLVFEYVWDDENRSGFDIAIRPRTVILHLERMHETRIVSALPLGILEDPDRADWGLTEVALVRRLTNSDLLANYAQLNMPLHHLAVEWEGKRRIDVVFSAVRVEEGASRLTS